MPTRDSPALCSSVRDLFLAKDLVMRWPQPGPGTYIDTTVRRRIARPDNLPALHISGRGP